MQKILLALDRNTKYFLAKTNNSGAIIAFSA